MASIKKIPGKRGISYKITVALGRDASGKQIRHYMTWHPDPSMTARQAEKAVKQVAYEFEQKLEHGFQLDNRQTFEEFAAYCMDLRKSRGDKPGTLVRIQRLLPRINQEIGHLRLLDIRPRHLSDFYLKLAQPGSNASDVTAVAVVDLEPLLGNKTRKAVCADLNMGPVTLRRAIRREPVSVETAKKLEEYFGQSGLFETIGGETGLSSGTIIMIHSIISSILSQAEKEMIIPFNPAARASLPRNQPFRESRSLQAEEIQSVMTALESEPIRTQAILTVLMVTGCRRGELCAMRWDKLDFSTGLIKIDATLSYLKELGLYEGNTKTGNVRFLTLPTETLELLQRYRLWQEGQQRQYGQTWVNSGYIFTQRDGSGLNPSDINRTLDQFCKRHGLPHINPHMLRHTAASIMISRGVDVLTVSKMLGHCNTTTTLNIYGHEIDEAKIRASECIADVILRSKKC